MRFCVYGSYAHGDALLQKVANKLLKPTAALRGYVKKNIYLVPTT